MIYILFFLQILQHGIPSHFSNNLIKSVLFRDTRCLIIEHIVPLGFFEPFDSILDPSLSLYVEPLKAQEVFSHLFYVFVIKKTHSHLSKQPTKQAQILSSYREVSLLASYGINAVSGDKDGRLTLIDIIDVSYIISR